MTPTYAARGLADLAVMGRVLLAVAWVVGAGLLDGCATVALPGAPWTDDFPRFVAPDLPVVPVSSPPAVGVREGDPAPFTGVLFDAFEIDEIQTAAEQRDVLVDALDTAYRGRAEDRAAAEVVFAAREEQIRLARLAAVRSFFVGLGAGAAAVLAGGGVIVLAR